MVYQLVGEFSVTAPQDNDVWLYPSFTLDNPDCLVEFVSSTVPQSWESVGYVFFRQLTGGIVNDFISTERTPFLANQKQRIIWENDGSYKLAFRLHKYCKSGLIRIWQNPDYQRPSNVNLAGSPAVVIPFAFGDVAERLIHTFNEGEFLISTRVIVDVAFPLGITLRVGTLTDPDYFMPASQNALFSVDTYEFNQHRFFSSDTDVYARLTQNGNSGSGAIVFVQ